MWSWAAVWGCAEIAINAKAAENLPIKPHCLSIASQRFQNFHKQGQKERSPSNLSFYRNTEIFAKKSKRN